MTTILIPTDFKAQTLNCVPELLKKVYPERLNIILVHLLDITYSEQELLMLARRSSEYRHIPGEFYAACARLKKLYPERIDNFRIEFFYGSTVALFNNLLEANSIDVVVKLNDYHYDQLTQNSIDPTALIARCNKPVVQLDCKTAVDYDLPKVEKNQKNPLTPNAV
ncbi:hypothetical protein BDD43_1244 [Mucilaginibacter gracilis]|uniref:Nucleotide-binding universal stress UspA family protein n=1 Tax=Mucilaginibacter gracilis TaxID=423350 RepID=A0A495IWP9_9SPHI|nr:hypothetical protein [Mucilaginibacter gracilis]RKR81100.1 hypothetical protein BDD43_1244 [Mucilaginibacter gracilis]